MVGARVTSVWLALFAGWSLAACGDPGSTCSPGQEGCPCAAPAACDPGLACYSMLCVDPGPDPTTDPTTAPSTAPPPAPPPVTDGEADATSAPTTASTSDPGPASTTTDVSTTDAPATTAVDPTDAPVPTGVELGDELASEVMGMPSGEPFHVTCPAGQILTGLAARSANGFLFDQLAGACSTLQLVADDDGVRLAAQPSGATLPWIGTEPHDLEDSRSCPSDHALVSVIGFPWGGGLDNFMGLRLMCAPLGLAVVDGAIQVDLGAALPQPILGTIYHTVYATFPTCPAGHVASGLLGHANNIPRELGLVCSRLDLAGP